MELTIGLAMKHPEAMVLISAEKRNRIREVAVRAGIDILHGHNLFHYHPIITYSKSKNADF